LLACSLTKEKIVSDPQVPNEFVDGPDQEPLPETIEAAVKNAIAAKTPQRIELRPCPCGELSVTLMMDAAPNSKIGRATCGTCGTWGVDFLVPRSQDQNLVGMKAAEAWNEAPRG